MLGSACSWRTAAAAPVRASPARHPHPAARMRLTHGPRLTHGIGAACRKHVRAQRVHRDAVDAQARAVAAGLTALVDCGWAHSEGGACVAARPTCVLAWQSSSHLDARLAGNTCRASGPARHAAGYKRALMPTNEGAQVLQLQRRRLGFAHIKQAHAAVVGPCSGCAGQACTCQGWAPAHYASKSAAKRRQQQQMSKSRQS